MVPYRPTQESIVYKLVLAFATVAVFGLSTAAFAQNPAASTQVGFLLGRHRAAAGLDDGVERLPLVAHVALDGFLLDSIADVFCQPMHFCSGVDSLFDRLGQSPVLS